MPPPAPPASPEPPSATAPTIQPDVLRQAAGAGARLAVAQALTPKALEQVTLRYASQLAAAFVAGSVFGGIVVALLSR